MGEENNISINIYGYISHYCLLSAYHESYLVLSPIITKIQQDRYHYPHLVSGETEAQ